MSTEEQEVKLNPEQQAIFDYDFGQLQAAGQAHGLDNLEARTKFGLDPASMLVLDDKRAAFSGEVQVQGPKPYAEAVVTSLGTSPEKVWPLIKDLHVQGPWDFAERLKAASEPEVKVYLVLAAACHESGWSGYAPADYLADRNRVVDELSAFTPADFEARKNEVVGRVKIDEVKEKVVDGITVEVPVAVGDVALPLSTQGYKGCVAKAGEMRFAQTSNIPDTLLENAGLVPGFAEVYNGQTGGFDRVALAEKPADARVIWVAAAKAGKPLDQMEPIIKRIGPGYVLAYKDEELAVELVAQAIAEGSK